MLTNTNSKAVLGARSQLHQVKKKPHKYRKHRQYIMWSLNFLYIKTKYHDIPIIYYSLGMMLPDQNRNIWPTADQECKQGRNVSHQPPVYSAWEPGTVLTHSQWYVPLESFDFPQQNSGISSSSRRRVRIQTSNEASFGGFKLTSTKIPNNFGGRVDY